MATKILCTDGFSKAGLDELGKNSNFEVTFIKAMTNEELIAKIEPYQGLIVRSASKVTKAVIDAGKNLKIIARAGVGVDNIDVPHATTRGICVCNAPAGNTVSTAELSFAMMLSLARHIPQAAASLSAGQWEKKKFQGHELARKTLGVIGLGRIGREVARMAQAFHMRVVAHDPHVNDSVFSACGVTRLLLEELLKTADFITMHTILSPDTENMISAKQIALMKTSACIINCARGGLVNEHDLANALKEKRIAGAALDVFTKEPYTDTVFAGLDNIVLTPHLGASTDEAQDAVAIEAAQSIEQFFKNGTCPTAVNAA
jgi:D-3-phosphoglycerate dehydrogenase / 2-oxoglutarate reductase